MSRDRALVASPGARLRAFAPLAASMLLAGCGQYPGSTFKPNSDLARWVMAVYFEVIGWDTAILILIATLVFLVLFRFSTRAGDGPSAPPQPHHGHFWLEVAWTLGPAAILIMIAVPSLRLVFRSQQVDAPPNALIINITAHQWWWEASYPQYGIHTANEFHIPVNRPVRFLLQSADVIHSFWVPQMGGKRDVVPGHTNELTFTPFVVGRYLGECAEFCGLSHANMHFHIVVDTPVGFDDWRTDQLAAPVDPRGIEAHHGELIFATSACTVCHTIAGASAGRLAPDLTHFASRRTFAGGMYQNNPANVASWIEDPEALKPGAEMPPLGLRGKELADLVAYLESLK